MVTGKAVQISWLTAWPQQRSEDRDNSLYFLQEPGEAGFVPEPEAYGKALWWVPLGVVLGTPGAATRAQAICGAAVSCGAVAASCWDSCVSPPPADSLH